MRTIWIAHCLLKLQLAMPNFREDKKRNPAMCLEERPVYRSSSCQHVSLAKTWLLDGLEGKKRTLILRAPGQGQRWAFCDNPALHYPKPVPHLTASGEVYSLLEGGERGPWDPWPCFLVVVWGAGNSPNWSRPPSLVHPETPSGRFPQLPTETAMDRGQWMA